MIKLFEVIVLMGCGAVVWEFIGKKVYSKIMDKFRKD